ncbi:Ribosomally synthesized cyclic peptide ustiloxin B precursosr [Colletotrichum viniferum]|nr:Ribosomally synthesized cyclic peptide ustiloxin B precursosr [Colletotrichum viniferum]
MKLSCVTAVLAFVTSSLALPKMSGSRHKLGPNIKINKVLVERDGGEAVASGENNPATDYVTPIDKRHDSPATDYVIPIDKRDENPATDYVIPIDKRDDSPATDYVIPIDKREDPADPGGDSPATDYVIPIDK